MPCSQRSRGRPWRKRCGVPAGAMPPSTPRTSSPIALLIGSVVPLNLRLLGVWRGVSREAVVRVLAPVAASGLTLALVTGPLLFSVRAQEYSGIGFLQLKLIFIAVGVLSTLALCWSHGFLLKDAPRTRLIGHAILSMVCWLGALACGRLIAFAGD